MARNLSLAAAPGAFPPGCVPSGNVGPAWPPEEPRPVVLCPGLLARLDLPLQGRRTQLGVLPGARNDRWTNGVHPGPLEIVSRSSPGAPLLREDMYRHPLSRNLLKSFSG